MPKFNSEFIRRMAMGDPEAIAQVQELPLIERMSIGSAVHEMRRTENIVPQSSGLQIYEEQKSSFDEDGVVEAMRLHLEQQKAAEENARKIREEFIAKEVKAAVERGRSGLPRNDRLPK